MGRAPGFVPRSSAVDSGGSSLASSTAGLYSTVTLSISEGVGCLGTASFPSEQYHNHVQIFEIVEVETIGGITD